MKSIKTMQVRLTIIKKLEEKFSDLSIEVVASEKKQYAAAINAEYRSGQLAGAYVDRKEVTVTGLEGMSREELENKLKELNKKIDGYNAKTIEVEPEQFEQIEKS